MPDLGRFCRIWENFGGVGRIWQILPDLGKFWHDLADFAVGVVLYVPSYPGLTSLAVAANVQPLSCDQVTVLQQVHARFYFFNLLASVHCSSMDRSPVRMGGSVRSYS